MKVYKATKRIGLNLSTINKGELIFQIRSKYGSGFIYEPENGSYAWGDALRDELLESGDIIEVKLPYSRRYYEAMRDLKQATEEVIRCRAIIDIEEKRKKKPLPSKK